MKKNLTPIISLVAVVSIFFAYPGVASAITVYLTTASASNQTWTVPAGWNSSSNTIEVIGGGGGGAAGSGSTKSAGGGGGAYSKISNLTLTPGASVTYRVGLGGAGGVSSGNGANGGDTWFNGTTLAGASVGADHGDGATGPSGAVGGASGTGVGTTKYSGGSGANAVSGSGRAGAGGGGGAAGPGGAGKNGGTASTASSGKGGGGGGGSGGGSSTAGSNANSTAGAPGGQGPNGTGSGAAGVAGTNGGGGGGGNDNAAGGNGGAGTQFSALYGSGGGGGGGETGGGSGGLYGGGGGGGGAESPASGNGGNGAQGIIVITYTDGSAPTPDPMTFSSAPNNASASSIAMTASTASDSSTPLEYIFNFIACAVDAGTGGDSSAWQSGTSYTDTGLQPNKCYKYTTQARDAALNANAASGVVQVYTSANTPGTPLFEPTTPTATTARITNNENGNPTANPATQYLVQVIGTTPSDPTWLNKYVNASGNPSASAVWLTDGQIDALTVTSLYVAPAGTCYVDTCNAGYHANVTNTACDVDMAPLASLGSFYGDKVRKNNHSILHWEITGITGNTCTISPDPTDGVGVYTIDADAGSGTVGTGAITQATRYTLSCTNGPGAGSTSASLTTTINLLPSFQEI